VGWWIEYTAKNICLRQEGYRSSLFVIQEIEKENEEP
jgi:hypothetical protein